MSKSIKKMTLDAGNANIDSVSQVTEKSEGMPAVDVPIKEVVQFRENHIDAETQCKLNQLEDQNSSLLKEKSVLEAKIAEYIEELTSLRAAKNENNKQTPKIEDMQKEIADLKDSIAQYLRRISDLTFENANLTVQLKELSSKTTGVQNSIPSIPSRETRLEQPVYNPYKQNGYSSWN